MFDRAPSATKLNTAPSLTFRQSYQIFQLASWSSDRTHKDTRARNGHLFMAITRLLKGDTEVLREC